MIFQAVRNERRRGLVVGSLDSDPEDPKFKSESETAKKTKKTVAIHHNKSLGVNAKKTQHTSPCSSAAERLQHRRSPNLTAKVRKTDGYRLISGRSQDRNLSGA
jgi:hypothetical protein